MITIEELYNIGKFQKTHALKGELNMILDIDPDYFLEGNPMIINYDGIYVPYYVDSIRPKGSTSFLVKLKGIDSEQEATDFVNKEIYMLRKDVNEWIGEDFEDAELYEGYKVINDETNEIIGEIVGVEDSTSNVLFVVSTNQEEEILIPANDDLITDINEERRTVRMKIPDGLLEI